MLLHERLQAGAPCGSVLSGVSPGSFLAAGFKAPRLRNLEEEGLSEKFLWPLAQIDTYPLKSDVDSKHYRFAVKIAFSPLAKKGGVFLG